MQTQCYCVCSTMQAYGSQAYMQPATAGLYNGMPNSQYAAAYGADYLLGE